MRADPKINERLLLRHLREINKPCTPDVLRFLCNMSLLACHDRAVTSEFFISVINICSEISSDLAMMEKGGALRHILTQMDGTREPTKLDETLSDLVTGMMRRRVRLADMIELVAQCPTSADKVS